MYLAPSAGRYGPSETLMGRRVEARPPTMAEPVVGTVAEIEGNVVSIQVGDGTVIAVHVVDIHTVAWPAAG